MEKFREILRLHELGHTQSAIAQSCAVSRSTVQNYLRLASDKELNYEGLRSLSDSEAKEKLGKGKRSQRPRSEIDFAPLEVELQRKGVTLVLLWQEGLDRGDWQCSYATFWRRYAQWRLRHQLSLRHSHKGGEKLFVDYCGVTVPVKHPDSEDLHLAQVFVACLGASNYTYAEATPTQELRHWIGAHERALTFFGGVPRCIVPDNLKSGVTHAHRYEPGINRSYQEFAEHYGVAILPARPNKPRDKAKVEKAVQEVERRILAPLRQEQFTTFTDLNRAISEKLGLLNGRVMSRYGVSRQALFEQVDKPVLSPLPSLPLVLGQWKQLKVSPDYHVTVEQHAYSVPYWLVGELVQVKLTEQVIEIFHDHQRLACHERSSVSGGHTTLVEHLPLEHLAYKQQSQERYQTWAQRVGTQTNVQVASIFAEKAHPEQAFRSLKGLQRLAQQYGSARLELACQRANLLGLVGYQRLRSILETQLDKTPVSASEESPPGIDHANVRGKSYYH
jgi:transposase